MCSVRQFDDGHFGAIALTGPQLQNTCISPRPLPESRTDLIKQFLQRSSIFNHSASLTATVYIVRAPKGDELFHDRSQFLGFRLSGANSLVDDQARGHIPQHGLSMAGRST